MAGAIGLLILLLTYFTDLLLVVLAFSCCSQVWVSNHVTPSKVSILTEPYIERMLEHIKHCVMGEVGWVMI